MRTFRLKAPIIVGAGALLFLVIAPPPLKADDWRVVVTREASEPTPEFAELKTKLDGSDRQAAAQALQLAMNELGDGVTLVWCRPEHALEGRVKPVSAFREDHGRVCRHLVYSISLGGYSREIEASPAASSTAPGRSRADPLGYPAFSAKSLPDPRGPAL
jgi:hypothetical protein